MHNSLSRIIVRQSRKYITFGSKADEPIIYYYMTDCLPSKVHYNIPFFIGVEISPGPGSQSRPILHELNMEYR